MKSSPIKYSFVRIANWLICFWFNIMIIHGSDVWRRFKLYPQFYISHSLYISHGISWVTHGISRKCFDGVYPPSWWSVEWGDQGRTTWTVQIWWLSDRECPSVWVAHQTPTSVSSSRSGLCQYNIILNVIHISVFKLWLSAQWISKQNEFQTSRPFTADSSPRQCLQAPD